jgi:hypothetical protein
MIGEGGATQSRLACLDTRTPPVIVLSSMSPQYACVTRCKKVPDVCPSCNAVSMVVISMHEDVQMR